MDSIFSHFIARGERDEQMKRLSYADWFLEAVPEIEFKSDERLFYEFLDYCVDLNIPVTYKYLQVWLSTELKEVLHATNVHVTGCESLRFEDPLAFETAYRTTVEVLSDDFNVLEAMESAIDDFKVEVASYFTRQRKQKLTQALADTFERLNATEDSDDAADFAIDALTMAKDIYDVTKLEDLDLDDIENRDKYVMITDSGIPAIDKDSMGASTSQLIGIEAQPGTGKTRFVIGTYAYRALTIYSRNVAFFALEQKKSEIKAMFEACHMFWMFNIQISDTMIRHNDIPDEIRAQYEAAKYDLWESGKYGKLSIFEEDFVEETFIRRINILDKLHGPFDLIIIDYMGMIEGKSKDATIYTITKYSYKHFKRYVRRHNKVGIAVAQFNTEGIEAGKADKEITTNMAEGGIAVYKNTDYNIAISMTPTMRLQQKRRFSQPKVRGSAGFPSFIADTRLGFCYFKQVVNQAV